jgi:hypothetical protein
VFKALRYLCDDKTVFLDGSIAHEMEPTVYYALALIEVLRNWCLPEEICETKPTMELYDYILWHTPARSTYERLLRTKAESESSILRDINEDLTTRLVSVGKQLGFWQSFSYGVAWLITLVLLVMFSDSVTATTLTIPVGFRVENWEVLLTLVGSWATLGYAGYRFFVNRSAPEQ